MSIGEMIHNRRKQLGLTLEEIGISVGVSKSTVRKWETGHIANIKRDKIAKLAFVLQMDPVTFISGESNMAMGSLLSADNLSPLPDLKKIPLLGTISCGSPILAQENVLAEMEAPLDCRADFALRCKGDSMIDARINDGDIVYIRSQPTVDNGEIAAVLIEDEATLKRVFIEGDTVTLVSCNSQYQPFVFSGPALERIKILGKAVGFTSKIQ